MFHLFCLFELAKNYQNTYLQLLIAASKNINRYSYKFIDSEYFIQFFKYVNFLY